MGLFKPIYVAAGALTVVLTGCGGSAPTSNNPSSAQMQSNDVAHTPSKTQQTAAPATGNALVASQAPVSSAQHNSGTQSLSENHSSGGIQPSGGANSTGAAQSKGDSTTQLSSGMQTTARVIHIILTPNFSSGPSGPHCWIMPTSELNAIFPSTYTLTGYTANIIGRGTFTTFDITASKLDAFNVGADGRSLWFDFSSEDAGHQVQFIFKGKDAQGNTIEAQSQLFTIP